MSGLPIKIQDEKGFNKKIGSLELTKGGRVYRKAVEREKHFMRICQGYGIQKEIFDKYLRGKKGRIIIYEKDTGHTLVASVETWTEHSRAGNYGDGKQIFLAERFMHGAEDFDRSEESND
jgi:hypothetical protein